VHLGPGSQDAVFILHPAKRQGVACLSQRDTSFHPLRYDESIAEPGMADPVLAAYRASAVDVSYRPISAGCQGKLVQASYVQTRVKYNSARQLKHALFWSTWRGTYN
jgi:hypothetical protein